MKERSLVYAKILFLILSINLFLCFDIVECTEKLLTFVNLSLEEKNKIPILNPMCNSDYKYHNGVAFGKLSENEIKEEYIANFVQYIKDNNGNAVFLEIIFTMNKSWENTDLFKKLKSTDEAIIFEDLEGFCEKYKVPIGKINVEVRFKLLQHIYNLKHEENKEMINNDEDTMKKNTIKRYYVITSEEKLQMLVNIIEKGIIGFMNKYEYISYTFNILHSDSYVDLNNLLRYDVNRFKEINFHYGGNDLIGRK